MAGNGIGAHMKAPGEATLMVSLGKTATADGMVRYTAGGQTEGLARFWLELTVFGDHDVTAFLATVAKALAEQRSRIVRPA